MMTSVITNAIANVPKLKNSHVYGWAKIWSDQLKADINHKCDADILNYDCVYIEHGVNFGGGLNLFGGANKELFEKISLLASCENIVSLDHDMPDWGKQLKGRIGAATTYAGITAEWCDKLSERLSSVKSLKQQDLDFMGGITVGDSHSNAYSGKTDRVFRTNGKTLFGVLASGLDNEFRGIVPSGEITLSYGSIDIRHHILRHSDFELKPFVKKYVSAGLELQNQYDCKVKFAAPVPVEYEGRKLPKTGYYKGSPFYGSREERYNLTMQFIEQLHATSNGEVVMPPEEWYYMDPEEYASKYMEHGSSVHISPVFYRRSNWDQSNV